MFAHEEFGRSAQNYAKSRKIHGNVCRLNIFIIATVSAAFCMLNLCNLAQLFIQSQIFPEVRPWPRAPLWAHSGRIASVSVRTMTVWLLHQPPTAADRAALRLVGCPCLTETPKWVLNQHRRPDPDTLSHETSQTWPALFGHQLWNNVLYTLQFVSMGWMISI